MCSKYSFSYLTLYLSFWILSGESVLSAKCSLFTYATSHRLPHNRHAISPFWNLVCEREHNRNTAISDVWLAWPQGSYEVSDTAGYHLRPPRERLSIARVLRGSTLPGHIQSHFYLPPREKVIQEFDIKQIHDIPWTFHRHGDKKLFLSLSLQEGSISTNNTCSLTREKRTLSFRNSSFHVSCLWEWSCWCEQNHWFDSRKANLVWVHVRYVPGRKGAQTRGTVCSPLWCPQNHDGP